MPSVQRPAARTLVRAAVALLILATALLGLRGLRPAAAATAGPQASGAAVRIMPLGDSITGSPGCWRALLWNKLQSTGYTDIDMVGTLPAPGCGVPYDGDNEGHGGYLATNVADQNLLPGWLSATRPDVVIMHFGTNDVWSDIAPSRILTAFTKLVGQMRASNPAMKILVAQILPMNPANCSECGRRVIAFNQQIPTWAQSVTTAQSPVTVVDQWTGFNDATDTYDGVHPNDNGNVKMSNGWYTPLTSALAGTGTTTGGTTTGGTTTGGTTGGSTTGGTTGGSTTGGTSGGTGGKTCSAVLHIDNQWGSGFTASVTVTAGSSAISGWTVGWTWPGSQQVTNGWNAGISQSGAMVTAKNMSYNGSVAASSATSFGFQGTGSGSFAVPALSCTAS